MLITRECDYALRLIRNLSTEDVRSISSIAKIEHITNAIAYKVAGKLERGGLIESTRGNRGGYRLTRGADTITLLDVYMIMESNTAINECLREGFECPRNTEGSPCAVHKELERIQDVIFDEMGRKSLLEVMRD